MSGKIAALTEAYQRLSLANQKFIDQGGSIEAFKNLIEQRDLVMEDLTVLTQELVTAMEHSFPDHPFSCNSVAEAVRTISVLAPELEGHCNKVRSALKELIDSDKAVEKYIAGLKDEIKNEIGRVRQGSRGLKGYRQNQNYGSCFINKVK
ncbi:MAG: hypothetical protein CVV42_11010 [Candidatus Riflebacteria bacterium HGW-Riflebacteria-2]|nr:MAG: hypothetical protein CVV42_11010 [Candidatus Riflebacteria bacterium HGW-Riflebacteria-2]